jgi:hypothetical protein
MRADEWETILVRVDGLERNLPSTYAVADIALSSVFSAMEIGVTILAIAAYVREDRIEVTLLANNRCVQTSQWICSFVVIKLRLAADRLPGRGRMTLFTRNLHRPM